MLLNLNNVYNPYNFPATAVDAKLITVNSTRTMSSTLSYPRPLECMYAVKATRYVYQLCA